MARPRSNALQYGPASSIVTVRAEDRGDEVALSVHMEGEPIPEDMQRSMFDPLVRHAADWDGGSGLGLGLYFVRTAAGARGGRIDVDSGAEGTTFAVILPPPRAGRLPWMSRHGTPAPCRLP